MTQPMSSNVEGASSLFISACFDCARMMTDSRDELLDLPKIDLFASGKAVER